MNTLTYFYFRSQSIQIGTQTLQPKFGSPLAMYDPKQLGDTILVGLIDQKKKEIG